MVSALPEFILFAGLFPSKDTERLDLHFPDLVNLGVIMGLFSELNAKGKEWQMPLSAETS